MMFSCCGEQIKCRGNFSRLDNEADVQGTFCHKLYDIQKHYIYDTDAMMIGFYFCNLNN